MRLQCMSEKNTPCNIFAGGTFPDELNAGSRYRTTTFVTLLFTVTT
jgi:hypothetical protein